MSFQHFAALIAKMKKKSEIYYSYWILLNLIQINSLFCKFEYFLISTSFFPLVCIYISIGTRLNNAHLGGEQTEANG